MAFARETDAQVIAEGIEREGELEVLIELGVDRGQGYLLGRPAPLSDALDRFGLSENLFVVQAMPA